MTKFQVPGYPVQDFPKTFRGIIQVTPGNTKKRFCCTDTGVIFRPFNLSAETQRSSSQEKWTRIGRLTGDLQNIQVALQRITYMVNTSSSLIISGVLLTLIGFMGTFLDSIIAGALPQAMLSTLSSIKVYVFEPILVIGVILLVIGLVLYFMRPAKI